MYVILRNTRSFLWNKLRWLYFRTWGCPKKCGVITQSIILCSFQDRHKQQNKPHQHAAAQYGRPITHHTNPNARLDQAPASASVSSASYQSAAVVAFQSSSARAQPTDLETAAAACPKEAAAIFKVAYFWGSVACVRTYPPDQRTVKLST